MCRGGAQSGSDGLWRLAPGKPAMGGAFRMIASDP